MASLTRAGNTLVLLVGNTFFAMNGLSNLSWAVNVLVACAGNILVSLTGNTFVQLTCNTTVGNTLVPWAGNTQVDKNRAV